MKTSIPNFLAELPHISPLEREKFLKKQPVSLHWELRSVLYLGLLLISTSFGILIYKNIDSIGHDVVLIIISVIMVACFAWCFKQSTGYRPNKIQDTRIWTDYILLAGCLLLITLTGYLQFQYALFGNRWGIALFIPMILLFLVAYYFDHIGVLSLAIVNLAAWAGIAITPTTILLQNDFNEVGIMLTGVALGIFLIALSWLSVSRNIKAHFSFTYKNFGIHLFFISMLSLLFYYDSIYILNFLILILAAWLIYKICLQKSSTYLLVITVLYCYIGLSFVAFQVLFFDTIESIYSIVFYFILSGIGLILFFKNLQKKIKIQ